MTAFGLRWLGRSVEVVTSILIGRAEESEIILEDPLVSRRHASVSFADGKLWLEDLESRNGVIVNGVRAKGKLRLFGGDVLKVGACEIQVIEVRNGAEGGPGSEGPVPTRRFEPLGVVGQLADKALNLGHSDEAERLLSGVLEQLLSEANAGVVPNRDVLEKASELVGRLLAATGRGVWLNWLAQVYVTVRKPWPAYLVDDLYEKGRNISGYDRQGLRAYCDLLRSIQNELGPAERFQVGRIEGLERVLSTL
jgi:pSer/pThr/pTyr-binding forkhead associated (FHA) protein